MASTIKVTNIDTPDSTGNITVDRPLSGSGASLTALNAANVSGTHTNFTSTGIDDNATSTAMTIIASGGNVGIGTTSPASLLSVKGTLQIDHPTNASYYGTIRSAGDLRIEAASPRAIDFVTGGSVRLRVHGSGGICFNGDTATANALDDYEEGTFTPALNAPGNATYSEQTGAYTKIGNVVNIWGTLTINAIGSASSGSLAGLPFSATANGGLFITYSGSLAKSQYSYITGQIVTGTTRADMFLYDATDGITTLSAGEISSGGDLYFYGNYKA